MPYSTMPVFHRGMNHIDFNFAGIYSFNNYRENVHNTISFRPVIVVDSTL